MEPSLERTNGAAGPAGGWARCPVCHRGLHGVPFPRHMTLEHGGSARTPRDASSSSSNSSPEKATPALGGMEEIADPGPEPLMADLRSVLLERAGEPEGTTPSLPPTSVPPTPSVGPSGTEGPGRAPPVPGDEAELEVMRGKLRDFSEGLLDLQGRLHEREELEQRELDHARSVDDERLARIETLEKELKAAREEGSRSLAMAEERRGELESASQRCAETEQRLNALDEEHARTLEELKALLRRSSELESEQRGLHEQLAAEQERRREAVQAQESIRQDLRAAVEEATALRARLSEMRGPGPSPPASSSSSLSSSSSPPSSPSSNPLPPATPSSPHAASRVVASVPVGFLGPDGRTITKESFFAVGKGEALEQLLGNVLDRWRTTQRPMVAGSLPGGGFSLSLQGDPERRGLRILPTGVFLLRLAPAELASLGELPPLVRRHDGPHPA